MSADLYAKQVTLSLWLGAGKALRAGGSSDAEIAALTRDLTALRTFLGKRGRRADR